MRPAMYGGADTAPAEKFESGDGATPSCKDQSEIPLISTGGVRYTVPKTVCIDRMEDLLTVRFRVGAVYKNSFISVYLNDEQILHRKKPIMAPGEMEQIILQKTQLEAVKNLKTITIRITDC